MSEIEFEKIKAILSDAAVPFEVLEHAPVGSSEQAAQTTGTPVSEWLKCMLVKFVRKGSDFFVMVNLPADKRLDLKKVKDVLKAQDAKFEANLQSQFNLPAVPPRPVKPAPAPAPAPIPQRKPGTAYAAPAGKPASATGSSTGSMTGSMLSSSRNTDDSVRGRLRTSLRSNQPR